VTRTLALTGDRLKGYIPDRGAGRTLALVTFIDSIGTGLFLAGAGPVGRRAHRVRHHSADRRAR